MSTTDVAGASAPTAAPPKTRARRKSAHEAVPLVIETKSHRSHAPESSPPFTEEARAALAAARGYASHGPYSPLDPEAWPDLSNVVTEDDTPVDNHYSEKQQRLLTETLYTSWGGPGDGRPFLALANVGLFHTGGKPPLVPDMMLSLDVAEPDELWTKAHRSYFVWVYGKPPDVVVEVVSNREGGEGDRKLSLYARIGIAYYVIHDPEQHLSDAVLRVYKLVEGEYRPAANGRLSGVGLRIGLWRGVYEGVEETWLRWSDGAGELLLTGAERADAEKQRADAEMQRADAAMQRAEEERQRAEEERRRAELAVQHVAAETRRAERLAERLRALGVDPDAA